MNEAAMENEVIHYPDIVFYVGDTKFSISSQYVETISLLRNVFGEYNTGDQTRGMMDLSGRVMTLLDMRVILGLPSVKVQEKEFIGTIEDAKKAHTTWMGELERYMKDRDQFSLALDGNSCAFGKWFNAYQTDNQYLKRALTKMEKPHLELHQQARKMTEAIQTAKEQGLPVDEAKIEAAFKRAEEIYHHQMMPLFEYVIQEYLDVEREMVLVLNKYDKFLGLIVDRISHIGELQPMEDNTQNNDQVSYFTRGVSRDEQGDLVLLLDEDKFFERYDEIPAEQ